MRPVEPVTSCPPRTLQRTLFRQSWHDLVFLHWPADPFQVAGLLPRGTVPDLYRGRTYVGLVFFRLRDLAFGGTLALPYFGSFDEVNVHLYSRDALGRRGVVVRSLECDRLVPVLAAEVSLRLPYHWSRIRSQWFDNRLLYRASRRGATGVGARVWLEIGGPVAPDPVEEFLTNRWGLHGRALGRSYYLPSTHPAWSFRRCSLLDWDASLIAAAGLPRPQEAPLSVLYAPGVPVRFGAPASLPGT